MEVAEEGVVVVTAVVPAEQEGTELGLGEVDIEAAVITELGCCSGGFSVHLTAQSSVL